MKQRDIQVEKIAQGAVEEYMKDIDVPGQYNSILYQRIIDDGLEDRFVDTVKVCAMRNLSKAAIVRELNKKFGSYFSKPLTESTFTKCAERYPKLRMAMTCSVDLTRLKAIEKADKILDKLDASADNLPLVIKTIEVLDDGLFSPKNRPKEVVEKRVASATKEFNSTKESGTTVNFYSSRESD